MSRRLTKRHENISHALILFEIFEIEVWILFRILLPCLSLVNLFVSIRVHSWLRCDNHFLISKSLVNRFLKSDLFDYNGNKST